jgi:hypothetical protein
MANEQKTDLEIANELLTQIKPNVTTSDRKAAPFVESTVIQYLNGLGKDLDTAFEMLQFFRARIEERRKILVGKD